MLFIILERTLVNRAKPGANLIIYGILLSANAVIKCYHNIYKFIYHAIYYINFIPLICFSYPLKHIS